LRNKSKIEGMAIKKLNENNRLLDYNYYLENFKVNSKYSIFFIFLSFLKFYKKMRNVVFFKIL